MSTYSEFFLGSSPHVVHLELIEISHFRFTQTWRFVRNAVAGVTVTHESPGGSFTYEYMPLLIRRLGSANNMDQSLRVSIGDVGTVVGREIAAVRNANGMHIKPALRYRVYSSDDLTAPMFGPVTLEILTVNKTKQGVSFDAVSPRLNIVRTGRLYEPKDFPTMKTFFKNGI